jgi:hypothetical protein
MSRKSASQILNAIRWGKTTPQERQAHAALMHAAKRKKKLDDNVLPEAK